MFRKRFFYFRSEKRQAKTNFENFGDVLTEDLFKWMDPEAEWVWCVPEKNKEILIGPGSILSRAKSGNTIWGSGIMAWDRPVQSGLKIKALRGWFSQIKYQESHPTKVEVTVPKGDPGLLVSDLFPSMSQKKYKLGIIPHFVDWELFSQESMEEGHLLIDLRKDPQEVCALIASCERIISSSLHGVICAHSYGVPALHVAFSDKLSGDGIKFLDYYSSVGLPFYNPGFFKSYDELVQKVDAYFENRKDGQIPPIEMEALKAGLIQSFPK